MRMVSTVVARRIRGGSLRCCLALVLALIFAVLALPSGAAPPPKEEEPDFNPDRPGIADGSTVIGRRHFQIELGVQQETHNDSGVGTGVFSIPTLLRFGIDNRWEARIESSGFIFTRTSDPANGVSRTAGLAPISVGFKWQFQTKKDYEKRPKSQSRPSLGTIFRLFPASGSSDFRTSHTTGDLRLAADWDFTDTLSLNPNIGVAIYEDGQGQTFFAGLFALTLSYNPSKTVNLFIDTGIQSPEESGGVTAMIVDTGIAYLLRPNVQLDFSVGTGVLGRGAPHPFLGAGISVRF